MNKIINVACMTAVLFLKKLAINMKCLKSSIDRQKYQSKYNVCNVNKSAK